MTSSESSLVVRDLVLTFAKPIQKLIAVQELLEQERQTSDNQVHLLIKLGGVLSTVLLPKIF